MDNLKINLQIYRDYIKNILSYVFLLFVVLECNSIYRSYAGREYYKILLLFLCCGFACLLLLFRIVFYSGDRVSLKNVLPLLIILVFVSIVFLVVNVRHQGLMNIALFCGQFLVFLPVMICLFRMDRKRGETYQLLFKHSDLITGLACLNVPLYIITMINDQLLNVEFTGSRWSGLSTVVSASNYFNVLFLPTQAEQFNGIWLYRDWGIFTEPPMFCIPLIVALSTELFLRKNKWSIFRALILSIAVVCSLSTLGMMMVATLWGLKLLQITKGKLRIAVGSIGVVGVCAVVYVLFIRKLSLAGLKASDFTSLFGENLDKGSIGVHINDYIISFKAWMQKPLFGNGFGNWDAIYAQMSEYRYSHNRGLSNSIMVVAAEGGIWLSLIPLGSFVICLLQGIKKKHSEIAWWSIAVIALYTVTIFHYRSFMLLLFAFGYSLIDCSKENISEIDDGKKHFKLNACPAGVLQEKVLQFPDVLGFLCFLGVFLVLEAFMNGFPGSCSFDRAIFLFMKCNRLLLSASPFRFAIFIILMIGCYICLKGLVHGNKEQRIAYLFIMIVALITVYLGQKLAPGFVGNVKTICEVKGLSSLVFGMAAEAMVYMMVLLSVVLIVAVACSVIRFIHTKQIPELKTRILLGFVAVALLGTFGATFTANRMVVKETAEEKYNVIRDEEILLLDKILDTAEGHIYAETIPGVYYKLYSGITSSTIAEDAFAAVDNATVIADRDVDYPKLFDAGYAMTQISDEHILYTNEDAVINLLRENGYTVTRHYSLVKDVDLQSLAEQNDLSYDSESGILVNGEKQSLVDGPGDYLESGNYIVSYKLFVDPALKTDQVVCTLAATAQNEDFTMALKAIKRSDFDKSGTAVINLSIKSNIYEDVEFKVLGNEDIEIHVLGISYKRSNTYDVVKEYNDKNRVCKETYYDFDGNPYKMSNGYYAYGCEYARDGLVNRQLYYDADGQLMRIKGGYAEKRITYNGKRIWTKEEYFDENGNRCLYNNAYSIQERDVNDQWQVLAARFYGIDEKPILQKKGYASYSRVYDNAGNVISEKYYGVDGKPCLCTSGYFEICREYDDQKKVIKEEKYDLAGNLIANK